QLRQLEADKLALEARLARQQLQLRDGIMARDATIRDLQAALARALAERPAAADPAGPDDGVATIEAVVGQLQRQLAGEAQRRSRLEERVEKAASDLAGERKARAQAETREQALAQELEALEATVAAAAPGAASDRPDLKGFAVLYVGG